MPRRSALLILVSVVSLASLVTCRPAEQDSFDLINEEFSDFPLSPNDESIENSPQFSELGFGSTESLLPTSFSGPVNTAFSLGGDLDPDSPQSALFDSSSSSSFPFQIADGRLCPGENRFAFCCKGEKCTKTAKCFSDEELNCCTVDLGANDDKTPYNCQPPSSPPLQGLQIIPESPSGFFSEFPSDPDSDFLGDFSSELFSSNFPGDSPVDTPQEPEIFY